MKVRNWNGLVVAILLLYHAPILYGKKKIVKLIVPQKIKYIHHTHVLLVKPSYAKRSPPVIREELVEEFPYRQEVYPSGRSKSKIRYILPYKELSYRVPTEDFGPSYMPQYEESYRRGMAEKMRHSNRNKVQIGEDIMDENVENWSSGPTYRIPSIEEEPPDMAAGTDYHTLPSTDHHHYSDTSYTPAQTSSFTEISPNDDWSPNTYSDIKIDSTDWNLNSHFEGPGFLIKDGSNKYHKPRINGWDVRGQSNIHDGSYYNVDDRRSYFHGKTDSYGKTLHPAVKFDGSWKP